MVEDCVWTVIVTGVLNSSEFDRIGGVEGSGVNDGLESVTITINSCIFIY